MELTQLTTCVLLLAASVCRGEIAIETSKQEKSMVRLANDLINIVTSCYKDQINGVGFAGNLPSTLIRRLSIQHSISVALIDNIWTYKDKVPNVEIQYRHKLHVFIIEASSFEKLSTLLVKNIKYSMWWNHMASFFILDLSPGCVKAKSYIWLAWRTDILNAKVMCGHHKSGRIIFNYNPFTSQAPVPWRKVQSFPGIRKHPFTLFSRKYRENETMCMNLDFDKTQNLAGHEILVHGHPERFLKSIVNIRSRGYYEFDTTRIRVFGTIFRALNGTLHFGTVRRNYDVTTILSPIEYSWALGYSMKVYPFIQYEVGIVTQFRGHKSQLNKILTVIDVDSRYGMSVVYLITLIFFKFFVHQALVRALLNLVRITCNTGFANLPNDTASRIYLGTLLFFVVTMQGIFQGDLAALLTKHIPLRNVNTIQDLEDLGYREVCGHLSKIHMFDGLDLKKNFIHRDPEECVESVKNDSSVACIVGFSGGVTDMVKKFNLHVGRKPVEISHTTFPIRWNWYLEQRVNSITARMVEANVIKSWDIQCSPIKLSDFYVDSAVKSNVDFKNIEFHEVRFTFVILGIGLVCATIVFIIELAMVYKFKCGIKIRCHAVRR